MSQSFKRALVIANPIAGRGRGHSVGRQIEDGLRGRGLISELYLTTARADARRRVAQLGTDVDVVVVVGGDGTVREVLGGLPHPGVPVAIVPFGTANVMSRDLGLPRDARRAVDLIAAAQVRSVDVGRVNGELCFLMTGIGFDAMAVREVERHRRGPITRWTYLGGVVRALRHYRPPCLTVTIDGVVMAGTYGQVVISNVTHYAGVRCLSSARRLDDGRFEVYLFRDARRHALLASVIRGALVGLPGGGCELRLARRVAVTGGAAVPYQIDGDYGGETPVSFAVQAQQYQLVAPLPSGPPKVTGSPRLPER